MLTTIQMFIVHNKRHVHIFMYAVRCLRYVTIRLACLFVSFGRGTKEEAKCREKSRKRRRAIILYRKKGELEGGTSW